MASLATSFFARLEARCDAINSILCVGLDPHTQDLEKIGDVSAEGAYKFATNLIDLTKHVAAAYKPNAAFFEALGAEGVDALARVIKYVPDEIPVLLDCKRGDIGSTAAAYAESAYVSLKADAVTVNPYMGSDSVSPFTKDPTKGVFVLCKTSNPSSKELQELLLNDSQSGSLAVFEQTASLASKHWNTNKNVGLVVGATDVDALERTRTAAPDLWILAPGIGAQGGDLAKATAKGVRADGKGLLVPVSRGIARADDPRLAAETLRDQMNVARAIVMEPKATGATKEGNSGDALPMKAYQRNFIRFAMEAEVLRFGEFTLKSGRVSPYFFNAGLFNSGMSLGKVGQSYANALLDGPTRVEYDVLFGPAYKGITLVSAVSIALAQRGHDVPFAYNRKEKKDHGEGGLLVGAPVKGKRVLIVDDVITAGTAIRQAMGILSNAGATAAGVVIALDRAEVVNESSSLSAIQSVEAEFGIPVVSIVGLDQLISYVGEEMPEKVESIRDYRKRYGVGHQ